MITIQYNNAEKPIIVDIANCRTNIESPVFVEKKRGPKPVKEKKILVPKIVIPKIKIPKIKIPKIKNPKNLNAFNLN